MTNGPSTLELVDQLAARVVRLTHTRHLLLNDPSEHSYTLRAGINGEVDGLRYALCLLKGWDPVRESGHEEQADSFVRVWHNLPGHCTEEGCGPW